MNNNKKKGKKTYWASTQQKESKTKPEERPEEKPKDKLKENRKAERNEKGRRPEGWPSWV
jgi:hypothetical protein